MDETWMHHFTPDSKRSSSEWTATGEPRPKRPKAQQSTGKVMASSEYYIALLERLKTEIAKKRSHMAKKKILFHQDNAPCHKSIKTMAKLHELNFELLPHPPYSPDLAPSDYWLFADLKKCSPEHLKLGSVVLSSMTYICERGLVARSTKGNRDEQISNISDTNFNSDVQVRWEFTINGISKERCAVQQICIFNEFVPTNFSVTPRWPRML
ncbi:hypothetical protein Trydic_g15510 [Trypoxylus dichotomus]